jgi:hypothetical protein
VGTAISPDHYVLEVSIPLKDIGLTPAQHRFVRANLVRNVYNRKQLGVGEALETSVWSATAAGNVDPQAAGWLIFSE